MAGTVRSVPRRGTAALSCALVLSACSASGAELPDRSDPAVHADEARLAALIGFDSSVLGEEGTCAVRLLRRTEEAAFVWAECTGRLHPDSGISAPMRVVGSQVLVPGDGPDYARDIRRLFPEDLVETVLAADTTVRP